MRLMKILPIVVLGLTSSLAMAQDVNCGSIANPEARQECMQRKYGADVDCSKLAEPQACQECLEHKHDNGNAVDCSTLATEELRRQCVRQKAK